MRVMIVGEKFPDSFADNFATALSDAGHDVSAVSPFRGPLLSTGRAAARIKAEVPLFPEMARTLQGHVVGAARDLAPELVINLDFRLSPRIVEQVTCLGIPTAFWFPDAVGNLGREIHVLAGYDAIFVTDSTIAERYRRMLGLNASCLPLACNPRWHRTPADLQPGDNGPALVLAGNMYATRFQLITKLIDAGIDVEIYGPPWPRWLPADSKVRPSYRGRYLAREAKARAFRGATAVLNPLASHEGDSLNCRLFEAAACGAVVLTEWRPKLPDLFEEGREVHSFRTFDELVERARDIVATSTSDRCKLGDAASARAHAEHGYAQRLERIVAVLGRG